MSERAKTVSTESVGKFQEFQYVGNEPKNTNLIYTLSEGHICGLYGIFITMNLYDLVVSQDRDVDDKITWALQGLFLSIYICISLFFFVFFVSGEQYELALKIAEENASLLRTHRFKDLVM